MKEERKTKREKEKEYRKLQKAIASLPEPSFNNPDKVQPTKEVSVPQIIPAVLVKQKASFSENKNETIQDAQIILDTNLKRIESVTKPRKPKVRYILSRLSKYLNKFWYYILFALLFAFVNSIFEILIPLFIGKTIDLIVSTGEVYFTEISKYLIYLSLSAVGFAFFKWLLIRITNSMSYKIEEQMHNDIFTKFNKVPLKYIDGSSHGDLQSRMINDVDAITNGFVEGLTTFFDCLATIVLTLIVMLRLNVTISIVILCVTPISIIVASIIAKITHKLFMRGAKCVGDLSGQMVEMVGNQKVVKGFLYESRAEEKFDVLNKKLRATSEKSMYYSTLSAPITRFLNGLLYATVAILGCIFALKGSMTVGNISVFLTYANRYSRPFNEIADVFADLQSAYASAVRVFNVLDMKNEPSDEGLPNITKCTGEVTFENVDFSYTNDKRLIQNFNLNVKAGQKIAIVGPTGCGKSTLINLLMRFYDVDKGQIVVSNYPIKSITRKSLRNQFGMVLQESWLFSSSIRDNIAYGKENATMQEIRKVSKLSGIDHFIQTFPDGYDTIINENGDNLSAGQKQLICIARLMLSKPKMLILDEATSNIDTKTELQIQEAFDKIMKGKTSFVVAHRLSTIISSDLILVMNKGNIIEQGTHKELLAKKGFYYNLYNSQFSRY